MNKCRFVRFCCIWVKKSKKYSNFSAFCSRRLYNIIYILCVHNFRYSYERDAMTHFYLDTLHLPFDTYLRIYARVSKQKHFVRSAKRKIRKYYFVSFLGQFHIRNTNTTHINNKADSSHRLVSHTFLFFCYSIIS